PQQRRCDTATRPFRGGPHRLQFRFSVAEQLQRAAAHDRVPVYNRPDGDPRRSQTVAVEGMGAALRGYRPHLPHVVGEELLYGGTAEIVHHDRDVTVSHTSDSSGPGTSE